MSYLSFVLAANRAGDGSIPSPLGKTAVVMGGRRVKCGWLAHPGRQCVVIVDPRSRVVDQGQRRCRRSAGRERTSWP